jgi:hypothetical protein
MQIGAPVRYALIRRLQPPLDRRVAEAIPDPEANDRLAVDSYGARRGVVHEREERISPQAAITMRRESVG